MTMRGLDGNLCLVTGGCGFIGSHLCESLLRSGAKVRVLDNLSSGYERNLAPIRDRVDLRIGDVRDREAVTQAMSGVSTVFHEAALVSVADSVNKPVECFEINERGALNVLEAARAAGVGRLMFAGTAASYGNDPRLPKREDMATQTLSPYAASKVAAEGWLRTYAELYGLETVILRYFNVYGPRQDPGSPYSGVISRFVDVVKAKREPVIFGDGLQTRDFVFVADVVRANLLAATSDRVGRGEIMNISGGAQISLLDLLRELGALTGRELRPEFKPARAGDVRHSSADLARARELLDYAPQVALREGLDHLLKSLEREF